MADTSAAEERLLRRVIGRFRCAQCHRQHSPDNVSVMGKYEAVWIVGVDCDGCRQPDMFVVSMRKDSSYERVTDLTDEEHEKFLAARSVEAQDVDRIRAFLRDFKGDFGSIFGSDQAKD